MMTLSSLAEFDDIVRLTNLLLDESCEPEFLQFVIFTDDLRTRYRNALKECERLMQELQSSNAARSGLERTLLTARQMLDLERKKYRKSEEKVQSLENQMALVRDLVWDGRNKLHDETRERLASVCSRASPAVSHGHKVGDLRESHGCSKGMHEGEGLSRISEADSTGSLLSELGYTRSEDELEGSFRHSKGWRKHRRSNPLEGPTGAKKPRSSYTTFQTGPSTETNGLAVESNECLVATTTVTVTREGPMTAKSTIEAIPSQEKMALKTPSRTPLAQLHATPIPSAPPVQSTSESEESMINFKGVSSQFMSQNASPYHNTINLARDRLNTRNHAFAPKTMLRGEVCEPCGKRIKFGKLASKCRDCCATVHPECKEKLPLPCVPATCTPTHKGQLGVIADFTPSVPPMIPALILHCVNEIEARGLKEVGIYRVSGSEREVKALKEKFLRGRGAPNLSGIDIHVVCCVVKDFLRSLREPLVTPSSWFDFVSCVEQLEEADQQARLYHVISDLPRPNRDTLAFMIMHLQRVSECPECKMPAMNLAKIFGPTIVGYSSPNPEPQQMLTETCKQASVMSLLMKAPSSFWAKHVSIDQENYTPEVQGLKMRTPSSSSIHRYGGIFNTPIRSFRSGGKKFFTQQ